MSQYKFLTRKKADKDDDRANFANYVCELLISNYVKGGSLEFVKEAFDHFEDNIDNIYELIHDHIPLFALYRLKLYGKDNFGFDDQEFDDAIKSCEDAIEEYYGRKVMCEEKIILQSKGAMELRTIGTFENIENIHEWLKDNWNITFEEFKEEVMNEEGYEPTLEQWFEVNDIQLIYTKQK